MDSQIAKKITMGMSWAAAAAQGASAIMALVKDKDTKKASYHLILSLTSAITAVVVDQLQPETATDASEAADANDAAKAYVQ